MKKDLGYQIRQLMAGAGIKTAKELADRINTEAGEQLVTPSSVGRWLDGQSVPKATSLMYLARALKVSADTILFGDSKNPEAEKELRKLVTSIVQEETKKVLVETKSEMQKELVKFFNSKNIPQQDKKALLRQVRNLLKLYEEI